MTERFEKLKNLLQRLFQLDQPDLDFGLYRVMHAKSAEVTDFLEKKLLPQVKEAFGKYQPADKAAIQAELDKTITSIKAAEMDPEASPKVKELRAKLKNEAVDLNALEADVYDHLYQFFQRYYSEGDFLSKRVYKKGVYAIPYEGEEVKLHWANADQYYIKTSEYLRDYAFRLQPDDARNPMRVHLRLVDAAEGEHGNVKEGEGKNRVFILAAENFMLEEEGEQGKELVLRFEYRPATVADWPEALRETKTKAPAQKDLSTFAEERVLSQGGTAFKHWIEILATPHLKSDGDAADYSRLRAHLNRYTARNTFDYFIHKDLEGFLRRELDFYIKNEVMHLDDIENETAPKVEEYLSKIKVIRKIAGKVIDFLAQLENFQKKLWLKKKFVTENQYLVALKCVPENLYDEILENESQKIEWKKILPTAVFSSDFLKSNLTLFVDTKWFSVDFANRLIDEISSLNEQIDGVLINSENFHALNLIANRYEKSVECIFADPPYNTGLGDFVYKDNFAHSSWMTMMHNRYELASSLLANDGASWTVLDNNESNNFQKVAESIFGSENFVDAVAWTDTILWEKVYSPRMDATQFSTTFDFIFVFSGQPNWTPNHRKIEPNLDQFPHTDEEGLRYRSDPLRKWGKNSLRTDRPNLWFPITSPEGVVVWPIKPTGIEACWRWQKSTVDSRYAELDWLDKGNGLQPYVRQYAEKSDWRPVETLWEYEEVGSTHDAAEELKAMLPGNGFKTNRINHSRPGSFG
jgi:adenine-specific DNA-methyltransferase